MTCNYCKSTTIKHLISDTNSTYTYCENCNNNYNVAHKHMAIDAVLKRVLETLRTLNAPNLKIEIKKENDLILLIVNGIRVFEKDFKYDLMNTDIYYLENSTPFTLKEEVILDYLYDSDTQERFLIYELAY